MYNPTLLLRLIVVGQQLSVSTLYGLTYMVSPQVSVGVCY